MSMVLGLAYLSGPMWVATTVSTVHKVALSLKAYMGGINCEHGEGWLIFQGLHGWHQLWAWF